MRFLLIEDHGLVRTGLKHVLTREFPSAQIDEATDARSAMEKLPTAAWDVVMLDLDLPDRSGLDLIHDVKSLAPRSRILVISGEDEEEFGPRVLKAGASGFVRKTAPTAELLAAIHRVVAGKKYVSSDLASSLVDATPGNPKATHEILSDRELEVLKQFGRGLTASQIADKLGVSVKTVSTYRARILDKLGLATTGDIVRYAVQHKLA